MTTEATTNPVLEAAVEYTRRGWRVVPIKPNEKRPEGAKWQNLRLTENELRQHFRLGANIGVLLGQPSNGLVDVDLDCPETSFLAPRFLPETGATFGRSSKEESHWLYVVNPIPDIIQHETPAPEGAMLVELRSTGGQTVFPPSIHPSGEAIYWNAKGDPANVETDELIRCVGKLAAAALLARSWPQRGARNKTALSLMGGLFRAGWDTEDVKEFVIAVAEAAGDEEVGDRVLSAESTRDKVANDEQVTGWPSLIELLGKDVVSRVTKWLGIDKGTTIGTGVDRTDLGNARRLANLHGEDVKWSPQLGWLVWDGKVWRSGPLAESLVHQKGETVVNEVVREAMAKGEDERKKYLAWAISMQSSGRLTAMVEVAKRQERILVKQNDMFDQNRLLLCCQNGTLDLETMQFREHRRDDFITKVTAAEYDPKAKSKTWERFLMESMGGDSALIDFLQQAVGYSLSGLTDEEKLFFVHGPAASGKSTFIESVKSMLGDYAATTDFETFLAKKGDSGARNDIARLAWVRLVSSVEVENGRKLAESLVKTLTGGDVISARFLYKELFEFRPEFKLWLVANHKPKVDDESAIWRRILVVPFEHSVPPEKRDPLLKRELTDPRRSGAAILAWAVEGYRKWRAHRSLAIPKKVEEATRTYRTEMDPLKDFIEQCCEIDPENADLRVSRSDLRERYVAWCKRNSAGWPINDRDFNSKLRELGVREGKSGALRYWIGISTMRDASADEKAF